jgi:cytochrome P450
MVATQASLATQVGHADAPISDIDPYSDEALIEPWAMYRELQGLGSAVWLTRYQMFALTRYDSVMRALKDASAFSSASGVMMNDHMNRCCAEIRCAAMARTINARAASSESRSVQRR